MHRIIKMQTSVNKCLNQGICLPLAIDNVNNGILLLINDIIRIHIFLRE